MTLGAQMAKVEFDLLDQEQRDLIEKTAACPDGISLEIFSITSSLLKSGRYPWGTSRRIYVPKPGKTDVMRPITIPPFMDRVVQHSIKTVLEAIYEPYFEKLNRSFGFRPYTGCHDAIYTITRPYNSGSYQAIEGDIKAAFDKLNKEKLIEIMKLRVHDTKFLELMKKRLAYVFFDTKSEEFVREKDGVPQGGIDSPYLWNIYMHEFDCHIIEYMDQLLNTINKKVRGPLPKGTDKFTKQVSALKNVFIMQSKDVKKLNERNKRLVLTPKAPPVFKRKKINPEDIRPLLLAKLKEKRLTAHNRRALSFSDANKNHLKYTYTRYADDWLILGNFPELLAKKIKSHIKEWLSGHLFLTLSEEKTIITDIRETPAHFLGFQITTKTTRKLKRVIQPVKIRTTSGELVTVRKRFLKKTAGFEIQAAPDKTRLINRMFMKGYCDKKGLPKEIPWLSTLEGFIIIERFNSVIRGIANYYAEFIARPRTLYRWIYIIRYACLKTLAQKYRLSIRKLMKKFSVPGKNNNVQITVTQYYDHRIFTKSWKLLTEKEAIENAMKIQRLNTVERRFKLIEYDEDYTEKLTYPKRKGKVPSVITSNFLESIHWVNLRQKFSMDLPCFLCGSPDDV